MPKTAADIPPVIKADYARIPRPDAVASADGDGYTKTAPMLKAQLSGKRKSKSRSQFGLPKSGGVQVMKMKG
jgi:hypothetical protein